MDEYEHSIGIAGTHGKTSTSTMLSYISLETQLDPTITIGGILENLHSNYRIGHSSYFIAEACEYSDSFLHFHPQIGIVLNVEAEHLDYFKTYERMVDSFRKYVAGLKPDGCLILNYDYQSLFPDYHGQMLTVSLQNRDADLTADHIEPAADHLGSHFDCIYRAESGRLTIHVPGSHNIFDCPCAIGAALWSGIPFEKIRSGLEKYRSPKKRFEYKGMFQGVKVMDDYAHHPSEIRATLESSQRSRTSRPVCRLSASYLQPYQGFLPRFRQIPFLGRPCRISGYLFRQPRTWTPEETSIPEIWPKHCRNRGPTPITSAPLQKSQSFLRKKCCPQDLLITMGAGDVAIIGEDLIGK